MQDSASFFTKNPWIATNYNSSLQTQFAVLNNNYNEMSTVARDFDIVSQKLGYVAKGAFVVSWGITGYEMVTAYIDNRPEDASGAFFSAVGASAIGSYAVESCLVFGPAIAIGCGTVGGLIGGFGGIIFNDEVVPLILNYVPKENERPVISEAWEQHYKLGGSKF